MAASRGLSSTFFCVAASLQRHAPCRLTSCRLDPLLIQKRDKTMKQRRSKAPPEPKHKDKWSKVVKFKAAAAKDTRATQSAIFLSRVPADDVWIRSHYPRPQLPLEECLVRHQELAHPSMLDNSEGFVYADMELNMKTNKKTKFLPNIKGTVLLPHQFPQALDPKIAIFCKTDEDLQKANSLGATLVGCEDLIKQISEGVVDKEDIDVFLCTPDAVMDILPIRAMLRDKFPAKKNSNIGPDLEEMWRLFTEGVTYSSQKETDAVSRLQVPLGQLQMPTDQLMANFETYVDTLCKGRAKNAGPLITQIFIVAPPSTERFLMPVEDYVPGYEKADSKQEEDSDSEDEAEEKGGR